MQVYGFNPCSQKTPHAQSSQAPCATNTEPELHERETTTMRSQCNTMRHSPHSLQLEKAHKQQWRPSAAKNKIKYINNFILSSNRGKGFLHK